MKNDNFSPDLILFEQGCYFRVPNVEASGRDVWRRKKNPVERKILKPCLHAPTPKFDT